MFFRVSGNKIKSEPLRTLPNSWLTPEGIQIPLKELWDKGYPAELAGHGWVRCIDIPVVYDKDTHKLGEVEYTCTDNVVHGTPTIVPLSEPELAEVAKRIEREQKWEGIEFEGVMCSATKDDMAGLAAVEPWVRDGNDVNYEFENGTILTLTSENIDPFRNTWIPFRASFFQ